MGAAYVYLNMRVLLTLFLLTAAVGLGNQAGDVKQRVKAARALGKAGSGGVEQLKPYLQDGSAEVRRAAVSSLAEIGGQAALDPLTAALGDGDGEVQMTATSGLVNFYLPGYYQSGWRSRLKRGTDSLLDRFREDNEQIGRAHV